MNLTAIKSCYLGPEISPEQFIPEHFFLFLIRGSMDGYDGDKWQRLVPGQFCLIRKNHLARYNKHKEDNQFEKLVVVLDEPYLKNYQQRNHIDAVLPTHTGAFIMLNPAEAVPAFIRSLMPYYENGGSITGTQADDMRDVLVKILLQDNPGISNILFDFRVPHKIDLEAYMNKNFKFNVSLERLAFLTGRSLSAFKRDFKEIFSETPARWLVQKRLKEAYFLIDKKHLRPSDIYIELGFEDLSHFSYAFRKQYGLSPSQLG